MARVVISLFWVLYSLTVAAQECPLLLGRVGSGPCLAVAKEGQSLYYGDGDDLVIADITDPGNPEELGRVTLPAPPLDILVACGHAYAACGFAGLAVVDLARPSEPIVCAIRVEHLVRATRLARKEHCLYLADEWGGFMAIFSLAEPSHPLLTNYFSPPGQYPSGLAVEGDRLYWAGYPDFMIFDLTQPDRPVLMGRLQGYAADVAVEGPIAVLGRPSYGGVNVVDVSNPRAPALLWEPPRNWTDPLIWNCYRPALKNGRLAASGANVILADLSDLYAPRTIASLGEAEEGPDWSWGEVLLEDDLLIAAQANHGLAIYRMGTPSSFDPLGNIPTSWRARRVLLQPGLAYVLSDDALDVFDIVDPTAPVLRGSLTLHYSDYYYDLQLRGNYLYFSGRGEGITIVDMADPSHPILAGRYEPDSSYGSLTFHGDYLYATSCRAYDDCYLSTFDLTDPINPVLVGSVAEMGHSLCVAGERLYVIGGGSLSIYDLSGPAQPARTATYPWDGWDCAASEEALFLYNVEGWDASSELVSGAVAVMDLTDPDAPRPIASIPLGSTLSLDTMVVKDGILYLWLYYSALCDPDPCPQFHHLNAWDVHDPRHPFSRGFWDNPNGGHHLDVIGDLGAFVRDGISLFRFNLGNPATSLLEARSGPPVIQLASGAGLLCAFDGEGSMTVYDASASDQPLKRGMTYGPHESFQGAAFTGTLGLFGYASHGLLLADLSDPSRPMLTPFYDLFSTPLKGVGIEGSFGYALQRDGQLDIWDFSNPPLPSLLEPVQLNQTANHLAMANGLGLVATDTGITLLSLADPVHPTPAGHLSNSTPITKVVLVGHTMIGGADGEIILADASVPSTPVLLSRWPCSWVHFISDGRWLVIVNQSYNYEWSLHVVDISHPAMPFEVASWPLDHYTWWGPVLAGGALFIPEGSMGIRIFDLRDCLGADPSPPVPFFHYDRRVTRVGNPIQFNGEIQGNPADTLRWDFGDGGFAMELSPSHTYWRAGRFPVRLEAENAYGVGQVEKVVAVGNGISSPPLSSEEGRRWLLPEVGHAPGAGASFWTTGLVLHNPSDTEVLAFVYPLRSAKDNSSQTGWEIHFPAGSTLNWDRFSWEISHLWQRLSGALLLRADGPLEGYAVISTQAPNGGYYGQTVPFVPVEELFTAGEIARVLGLEQTDDRRTNVGFASASATPITLLARYYGGDGALLGEKTYNLPPFSHLQDNEVLRQFPPGLWENAFMEVLSLTPEALFTAYASVVDNRTQDPSFIPAALSGGDTH